MTRNMSETTNKDNCNETINKNDPTNIKQNDKQQTDNYNTIRVNNANS